MPSIGPGITIGGGITFEDAPFANTVFSTPGTYAINAPAGTYVEINGAEGGYAAAKVSLPGKGGRLVIQVNSNERFIVVVGGKGGNGVIGGRNAGGGGGYSGIFLNSISQANYIGIAGGGGGCATGNPSEDKPGGNGAGNGSGSNGGTYSGTDFGRGATLIAGGAGGAGGGVNGSVLQAGAGANQGGGTGGSNGGVAGLNGGAAGGVAGGDGAGGGGGGGYYGGGGGGASTWGGGGGGGSGTFNASHATLIRASSGYKTGNGSIGFYNADPG